MRISLQGAVKLLAPLTLVIATVYAHYRCYLYGWGEDAALRGTIAPLGTLGIVVTIVLWAADNWDDNPSFTIRIPRRNRIPKAIVRKG